ncbi:MAG: hypothetical protein ACJA0U_000371 [Salibacteraceae bacterium]|jgi:hypothetical protein
MRKKIAILIAFVGIFVALLFFRPWEPEPEKGPRFVDRLPDANVIGRSNVLDLTRALSSSLYHYRIPFREFLSPEFILSQGKAFGIDFQESAFFFADEKDWEIQSFGILFKISDSISVHEGINRLTKIIDLKDTVVYNRTVYKYSEQRIYFAYGKDWLLVYQGGNFKRTYRDILFAKINEIPPKWRAFLNQESNAGHGIIAQVTTQKLAENGIESILITATNDSSSLTLNTQINQFDTLAFQIKKSGWNYLPQEFTRTNASIHYDIGRLRNNPNDPIIRLLTKLGEKINFPVNDLMNAWEGNVAFRQGGIERVEEKYIESELDENFNVTEVVKYKTLKVPGYSVYLSTNASNRQLINKLLNKGIMTKQEGKYRMLFSPPLQMNQTDTSLMFHTSKFLPVLQPSSQNEILFTHKKTPYLIYLDSTSVKTLYGRLQIPLDKIISDNINL